VFDGFGVRRHIPYLVSVRHVRFRHPPRTPISSSLREPCSSFYPHERRSVMTFKSRVGRFSEGQEKLGATEEKARIGTFGDGQALTVRADEQVVGRFSTGQEAREHLPEHGRIGSFGDVEAPRAEDVPAREMTARAELESIAI
jgi:hypothetical protein